MNKSGFGTLLVATAMTFTFISAADAYTAEQEAMCTSDAFRLCSSEIPDVQRVTACMVRNRSQLSSGCRAVMDASAPPAPAASYQPVSTAKPGKPMSITPQRSKPGI